MLYDDSEGGMGLIANSMRELAELMIAIPYWRYVTGTAPVDFNQAEANLLADDDPDEDEMGVAQVREYATHTLGLTIPPRDEVRYRATLASMPPDSMPIWVDDGSQPDPL